MSFEAKRLRVQLPCGEATVVEDGAPAAVVAFGFIQPHQCVCFGWSFQITVPRPVAFGPVGADALVCGGGTNLPDPGPMLVDPEHLAVIRRQLERKLTEIETAERALDERKGQAG